MAPYLHNNEADSLDSTEFLPATKWPPLLLSSPLDSVQNLSQLLCEATTSTGGLVFYSHGQPTPSRLSYKDLLYDAQNKARILGRMNPSSILLHFDTIRENIEWFWAATLAGLLPTISAPFVNDPTQRKKHLRHLHKLLKQPVILTARRLIPEFLGVEKLNIHDVESLVQGDDLTATAAPMFGLKKQSKDVAVLMLTSGSTGNAKAVPLRHGQLLQAIRSKSAHHGTAPGDVFLNWIGLDHVASLTEIHLHAMMLGGDQLHVTAAQLLRDPLYFIHLLDEYKVAYTFAPNFFLTKVRDSLTSSAPVKADLSSLKALISGGESNVVATCATLTQELLRLGVTGDVIRPGFGMTETCAGAIYAKKCPSYDLRQGLEFATLGSCIPGVEMRVMHLTEKTRRAATGETGELQVAGPVVFDGYFNNAQATAESFTSDGWFVTGDLAWLDDSGNLNLAGRTKDTIIVNGVKWSATELETAIEEEDIPGLVPSFTVAFPHRGTGSPTEEIAIVYSPAYAPQDHKARFETTASIAKTIALMTGRRPARVVPLPPSLLEKSSLGKISRTKVRAALENGEYAALEREDTQILGQYNKSRWRKAETTTEKRVQSVLAELLEIPAEEISTDALIFDLGVTSFNLILLKNMIQNAVDPAVDIPMSVLLNRPKISSISSSIDQLLSQPTVYNPIVPLQPHGSKTPLFCIHPGSGDILVFIALAAHFSTRPVYAIRTRGYNPGERLFRSIKETAQTYAHHIRLTQSEGPYAIAGYSLGSTLAYEVGRELEAQGQEVRFLASIDYPPHIAHYVRDLDWVDVLLHIAFFLELIDESTMEEITPYLHSLDSRQAALEYILKIGDAERAHALAVGTDRLRLISDIAENFRVNVQTYEPVGTVERLDIFVAEPPRYAARDRTDWRENKLGRWADFSRSPAAFHDCPGIHAKMLNREHMADFARIFKAAMKERGV